MTSQYFIDAAKLPQTLCFDRKKICLFGNLTNFCKKLNLFSIPNFQHDYAHGRHPESGYLRLCQTNETDAVLTLYDANKSSMFEVASYPVSDVKAAEIFDFFAERTFLKEEMELHYAHQAWKIERYCQEENKLATATLLTEASTHKGPKPVWLGRKCASPLTEFTFQNFFIGSTVSRFFKLTPSADEATPPLHGRGQQQATIAPYPAENVSVLSTSGHYSLQLKEGNGLCFYIPLERQSLPKGFKEQKKSYNFDLLIHPQHAFLQFYHAETPETRFTHKIPTKNAQKLLQYCLEKGRDYVIAHHHHEGQDFTIWTCPDVPELSFATTEAPCLSAPVSRPDWIGPELSWAETRPYHHIETPHYKYTKYKHSL